MAQQFSVRRVRQERRADLRARNIVQARPKYVYRVTTTAILMPAWCADRRIKGLTFNEDTVWLNAKDARFLMARDQECGGQPRHSVAEYRRCSICSRPLLGEDAKLRRTLDESAVTGRQKSCGSDCLEAAKRRLWMR